MERIKDRPTDRFLRKQRQCRIDTGSPCLTNGEGLLILIGMAIQPEFLLPVLLKKFFCYKK